MAPTPFKHQGPVREELHEAVHRVEERLARLEHALTTLIELTQVASALPDGAATTVNAFDDIMDRVGRRGVALDRIGYDLEELAMGLLRALPHVRALVDGGLLDPGTLRTLGMLSRAVAEASEQEPVEVRGLFGFARAMREVPVRRALGFALRVGTALGKALERQDQRLLAGSGARTETKR